ncbi:MAG TPA: hypothetical protein VMA31_09405 [Bryobacteraceae bacterium]|nr:hypothetical protein [Bryobacteraceae bacterium]
MSIAAAFAADKQPPFRPAAADSYSHQTSERVTIGIDVYSSAEKVKTAFGKVNPNLYGILPVLVVVQNNSDKTIRLNRLQAEYVGAGNNRVEATPARDVRYVNPEISSRTITAPGRIPLPHKKNPLDSWEIEGRAFAADSLPPGNSASGFFYFQAESQPQATIYLSGITEAGTGRELLYFEVPVK